jgi:hypothetical protein
MQVRERERELAIRSACVEIIRETRKKEVKRLQLLLATIRFLVIYSKAPRRMFGSKSQKLTRG